jgi:hypothetical protein
MFENSESINYWCSDMKRFMSIVDLVVKGMKDSNKNVKVTAIVFCSDLTLSGPLVNPFSNLQWFKLLYTLMEIFKTDDSLDKDSSTKIAISFFRMIKENTNTNQLLQVQDVSDIVRYMPHLSDELKTSIVESLFLENENDQTSEDFE